MDTKPVRELIESAKQMEEILGRNGVERSDLRWSERIAAAERALAEEDEALRIADVLGIQGLVKISENNT